MTPALRTRMSSLSASELNFLAAFSTESHDAKSSGNHVISTSVDSEDLIDSMAAVALDSVRAARKILAGLCFESWRIVSLPRPAFPERS